MNSVEINKLSHLFSEGHLTKEVLGFMLQSGTISISEWVEIQSVYKTLMTKEEIEKKYKIRL